MAMNESDKENLGKALGRLPSGLAILTTAYQDQRSAMLVSWFQQCSFDPPMISVAIKRGRAAEGALGAIKKFVLNLLHSEQKNMLAHFGKGFAPDQDPFVGIDIKQGPQTGLPVLEHSLAYLECQVRHVYDASDHQLVIGEVVGGHLQEAGEPMIHLRKSGFHY
ncbi:MAG: flavin reductase family protein [Deltaproteobacteria bacterium]|nr:flavin reductase family protein [Deltaproteobacteria bacterium]